MDQGCLVIQEARQSTRNKAHSTKESRQSNFLEYCCSKGISDPTDLQYPTDQSNFLLGCYVISLLQGDSILGLNLRSATINGYCTAAASLYTEKSRYLDNPFKPVDTRLSENYPDLLIKALSKYEDMPERQESITDAQFIYINDLAQKSDMDSKERALNDWFVWG